MTFIQELKSGRAGIYGNWSGLCTIVLLVVLGFYNFSPFGPQIWIFCVLAIVFALLMIPLEIPFCIRCCPTGPRFTAFLQQAERTGFRAILYLVFAVVMWLSVIPAATSLIVCAIFLTFTTLMYGIATFRSEQPTKSALAGGSGLGVQSL